MSLFKFDGTRFGLRSRILYPGIAIAILLILDQLLKSYVASGAYGSGRVILIDGFIALNYVQNTGMAFGLFADFTWALTFLRIIGMLFFIYLLIYAKFQHWVGIASVVLIISGGVGNIIDSLTYGYVVDMFEVLFVDFAIFNIADSLICCGAVLLGIYVLFFHKFPDEKTAKVTTDKDRKDGE